MYKRQEHVGLPHVSFLENVLHELLFVLATQDLFIIYQYKNIQSLKPYVDYILGQKILPKTTRQRIIEINFTLKLSICTLCQICQNKKITPSALGNVFGAAYSVNKNRLGAHSEQ